MQTLIQNVHFESHQDHSFWFGSLTDFARANSLTAGQLYDICEKLERAGEVIVRGCGSTFYTLRRETPPQVSFWSNGEHAVRHYA